MTVISVDPEQFRIAAAQLSDAAALLARSCHGLGAEPGAGDQAGWLAPAELAAAQQVWTSYLGGLHDCVDWSAQALRAAADTYAAAERQAGEPQRRHGGGSFA